MIDWMRVAELREEVGEDDFDEVVTLFLEEVADSLAPLRSDPICSDPAPFLHALRGSAANLGFAPVGQICEILEAKCTGAPMDLAAVVKAYDTSCAEFMADLPRQKWGA